MYLDVMNENQLAELFGKSVPLLPHKPHAVTHLQRKWLGVLPVARRLAIQGACICSHSYRGVRVGASAYCYSRRTGQFLLVNSGNLKLAFGWPKLCAEMGILRDVPESFDCIIGFSVYSEYVQPDPSGHEPPTLHMCPECREEAEADSRVSNWTRIDTFRSWKPGERPSEVKGKYHREHMSFGNLKKVHAAARLANAGN